MNTKLLNDFFTEVNANESYKECMESYTSLEQVYDLAQEIGYKKLTKNDFTIYTQELKKNIEGNQEINDESMQDVAGGINVLKAFGKFGKSLISLDPIGAIKNGTQAFSALGEATGSGDWK